MSTPPRKTLARSLGEFVGHIARGIKADPAKGSRAKGSASGGTAAGQTRTVGERVDERAGVDERGRRVILRRTTIDEVEYPDGP